MTDDEMLAEVRSTGYEIAGLTQEYNDLINPLSDDAIPVVLLSILARVALMSLQVADHLAIRTTQIDLPDGQVSITRYPVVEPGTPQGESG